MLSFNSSFGQNLVPNPGFEEYFGCPNGSNQLDRCKSWKRIGGGTPDFFNACAVNPWEPDVPNTWNGYQNSHSGDGMAGFYASQRQYGDNVREYLQIRLTQPLDSGVNYYVHFYVSPQDSSYYSVGTIGAYISDTITHPTYDAGRLVVNPQIVYSSSYSITDTMNWTLVSGTFMPHSNNLDYITIGNFFPDSSSRISNLLHQSGGNSYYFIDDVCVSTDLINCLSFVGLNDLDNDIDIQLFPNPFQENVTITTNRNGPVCIYLYDITARLLIQRGFSNSTILNTDQLSSGMYIYEVRSEGVVMQKGKLMKQ